MTKIKLCGLSRPCDIEAANALMPDYIGFVFAKRSRRYVTPGQAAALKKMLRPGIAAVGVFVDEDKATVVSLLKVGVIDMAQLHGKEDDIYVREIQKICDNTVIKAFCVEGQEDIRRAQACPADYVLLDSGKGGTGTAFDWELLAGVSRPYFLAGGLDIETVGRAVERWKPYGVDVSSGIETDGRKDPVKMRAFVEAVRSRTGEGLVC